MADLTTLHRAAGSLFEAPRYDKVLGLLFSDARLGGVYSWSAEHGVRPVIEHRRGIGGLVRHADGGLVVTGRNVAYKSLDAGDDAGTAVLLDAGDLPATSGFNDLTVDGSGRVFVGSLAVGALDDLDNLSGPMSALAVIDLDGSWRVVSDEIRLANGMAFSPDGRILYVCDSALKAVVSLDVDPDDGTVHGRRVFASAAAGVPDGMAVAADGSVWVALAYAGLVQRYAADGTALEGWTVPDAFVTSVCFGGPDDRQLFVTTAAEEPGTTAALYAAVVDVPGVEVPPARVATDGRGIIRP